ncbi:MAG: tRNA (N(6)-L-threonylcarbamoyladenosine(37)-C(2))-methylthiotransferase MtaB [Treponema sp.]|jgi:threonylcarbamoyladenosine tRNA methylthiotransferase MtaB|nr:tRNA (N(6)-L-threonylcarbamoyladenosine(37)-C(2))-methylthiotransferase MtaB [Treponema sp.]
MQFSVYTFGCKLNQLETEAVTDAFSQAGFTFVPWSTVQRHSAPLALMVINTCTVTSMADQKARRFIRKLLNCYPDMCLIVTGCYAQVEQEAIAALESGAVPRRLFVVPGERKDRLLTLPPLLSGKEKAAIPVLLDAWFASLSSSAPGTNVSNSNESDGSFSFQPERFASHSRALLKVQDGCDRRCAFCRVSIARGKSRSRRAEEALAALKSLENRKFSEVVISGVNITQYWDPGFKFDRLNFDRLKFDLGALLDFFLANTESVRLRLSSLEPDWLSQANLSASTGVFTNPRVRPHFHLSVQSGSDTIIKKMNRSYTKADIENAVSFFRSVRADPFIACDIIAGFPGETEADFEETFALCRHLRFAWIHAFPFSARPGTAAAGFPDKVSEREASRRVERLTELAAACRREYIERWQGREVEAVVQAGKETSAHTPGMIAAVSENYLKLLVSCGGAEVPAPGSLIRCRIGGCITSENSRFDATAELSSVAGICAAEEISPHSLKAS